MNINQIKKNCTGCNSCRLVCPKNAIKMIADNEGFLYPVVDIKLCVECSACVQSCPQFNGKKTVTPIKYFSYFNSSKEVTKSASGGVAFLLGKKIIEQGGVVYGAAYDSNLYVSHLEISSLDSLYLLQSSKYVQSEVGETYLKAKMALSKGRKVLFTGTACQIDGLYSFLGGDNPDLYTLDIICHGVPSPLMLERYVEFQTRNLNNSIKSINFRDKTKKSFKKRISIKTESSKYSKYLEFDKYGYHFTKGDCFRESCYKCKYSSLDRVGNITIGDFWGSFLAEHKTSPTGNSLILVNDKKGFQLMEMLKAEGICFEERKEIAIFNQGNLIKPTVRPQERENFYKDISSEYFFDKMKIRIPLKNKVKLFIPPFLEKKIKKIIFGGKNDKFKN